MILNFMEMIIAQFLVFFGISFQLFISFSYSASIFFPFSLCLRAHPHLLFYSQDIIDRLRFVQNGSGAVPSPFDCYLVSTCLDMCTYLAALMSLILNPCVCTCVCFHKSVASIMIVPAHGTSDNLRRSGDQERKEIRDRKSVV